MDLIVRTAHGTADVAVDVHDHALTLRDLLAMITGQAAPHAALVDGRPVDIDRPIRACGVLAGSVVDTDLSHVPPARTSGAALLQLTGPGAGTTRFLETGRYRVGPGRRVNAAELESAPVDEPAFELEVAETAARLIATRHPDTADGHTVLHDGRPLEHDEFWTTGLVTSGGRTFAFEPADGHPAGERPAGRMGDEHGRLLYNRPPGADDQPRVGLVASIRDAERHGPELWRERLHPGGACWVDLGLAADTTRPVRLDLASDLVVTLIGDHDTTTAHARALTIDAITNYGPADLEVAVAATPAHLGEWEWAKWLPHTRADGESQLLGNDIDLAVFAARRAAGGTRRTLLVVTADRFWSAPEAPLRQLVLAGPPELSVVVLTDRVGSAPASCDAVIEHRDRFTPGVAALVRPSGAAQPLGLLAPLPDAATANEIARHLAPLVDPDAPQPADAGGGDDRPPLADFVGLGTTAESGHTRWNTGVGVTSPAIMPIGTRAGSTIGVDLGPGRGVVVSGASLDDAQLVVRTLVASLASAWSPVELSIVDVDHRVARGTGSMRALPHHAGVFDHRGPRAARRFVERLSAASGRRVVVVDSLADTELAAPGLVAELARLTTTTSGLHLVVVTDEPLEALGDDLAAACPIEITANRSGGRRHATLHDRTSGRRTPLRPFEPPASVTAPATIVPFVFGRPLTSLERRIERRGPAGDAGASADRDYARLVDALVVRARDQQLSTPASLVPQPLPDRVPAEQLFATHPGDSVPLGLAEHVGRSEPVPYSWRPEGDASLLLVGSPRSGMRTAIDTLLFGAARRMPVGALRVQVVEHHDGRRAAFGELAVVERTATTNHGEAVDALLDGLLAELDSRAAGTSADRVPIVLVVRDLERLAPSTHDKLSALMAGAPFGVSVVASASRVAAVAGLVDGFAHVLVGELSDPAEYAELGITEQAEVEQRPGRCLVVGEQRLVQLATPPEPLDGTPRAAAAAQGVTADPSRT